MKCRVEGGEIVTDSLEFFLADTCNLACEHCASSAPLVKKANFPDLLEFKESLALLRRVMRSKQIKFLGGEPLLNKDIAKFLAAAKASGMFERVRVTTNGLLLDRMGEEFWHNVDVVEVSRYRSGENALADAPVTRIRETAFRLGKKLEVVEKPEFFAAVVDERIPDPETVARVYADCGEAHRAPCHTLYKGKLYRCSRVHTLDLRLSARGVPHAPFTDVDGLAIGPGLSADAVRVYLESPEPLNACSFCLGTSGRWLAQRQLSEKPGKKVAFSPDLLQQAPGLLRRMRERVLAR